MPLQKHKFKSFLITTAIIGGSILGWLKASDSYALRNIDFPKNSLLANGSFELRDAQGEPLNWKVTAYGPKIKTDQRPGYQGRTSLHIGVADYRSGNVQIESDKVVVTPNQDYFFKIYAESTIDCDLLIHFYYKDGSERYDLAEHYPAVDEAWSSMSTPIKTDETVAAVSLAIHTAGNGDINLDNAYLVPSVGYADRAELFNNDNSIPNPDLEKQSQDHKPTDWVTYRTGDNKAGFEYKEDGSNHYARVSLGDYRDGEAKWQYLPLAVASNQRIQLQVDYRSNADVSLVAEYNLADGTRNYGQISTLMPTNVWTRTTQEFETPPQAQNMFVALVLHQNGFVESDNYNLVTAKKVTSAKTFDRPLISLTFDDAWISQFSKAQSLLQDQNFPATFYINSGTVGTTGFMTLGQLDQMLKQGHQIASHGHQHRDITAMNLKAFQDQLTKTQNYLERKLKIKTIDYATPYGKHNSQTDSFIQTHHASHRGTNSGINTKSNFDPYDLQVLFIRSDSDAKLIQQFIDDTKISHGWLILVYHQLDASDNRNSITTEQFKQHLQVIKESNIQVVTVREALEEIDKQR